MSIMIFQFRITLEGEEATFRDIEIQARDSFEDFHNAIVQAYGFDGMEMASFYLTDKEWNPIEEFTLFDMSEEEEQEENDKLCMNEVFLEDKINEDQTQMVYIYDFLDLWTFRIELHGITQNDEAESYPRLVYAEGVIDYQSGLDDFDSSDDFDLEEEVDAEDLFDQYNFDDDEFDEGDFESFDESEWY